MDSTARLGFIGIGTMGEPMVRNLLKAGMPVMIWNRSAARCECLGQDGAVIAASTAELFAACETVILMLADGAATDDVLGRGTADFALRVSGRLILAMGTVSPDYSQALAAEIAAAGGRFVEAPVSGSRKPAEAGQLVAMLAGQAEDIAIVQPMLAPLCRTIFACGTVPNALRMKLAVNVFLITLVTGLAEATHFAARHDLDLSQFAAVLNAGPMASDVSRIKIAKLAGQDFTKQAAIADVLKNSRLVIDAARAAAMASPLMDICHALYGQTDAMGLGDADMVAVIKAIERRTDDPHGA